MTGICTNCKCKVIETRHGLYHVDRRTTCMRPELPQETWTDEGLALLIRNGNRRKQDER